MKGRDLYKRQRRAVSTTILRCNRRAGKDAGSGEPPANLDSLLPRDSQLATAARGLGFEVMGTQQKEKRLAATNDWLNIRVPARRFASRLSSLGRSINTYRAELCVRTYRMIICLYWQPS